MTDLGRAIDGRAAVVADWLMERLGERDVWLRSELHAAANQACISLDSWDRHPTVRAVPYVVEEFEGLAYVRMKPEEV